MKLITAQVWLQAVQNGYYVDVDGDREIDVTAQILALPIAAIQSMRDNREESDALVDPAKLDHDGPYYVSVRDSIAAFFGVNSPAMITQRMLDRARRDERASRSHSPRSSTRREP